MSKLKVTKIGTEPTPWASNPQNFTWKVSGELDGEPDVVQINSFGSKNPPVQEGQEYEGTVEDKGFGKNFRMARAGGGRGGFTPRPEDPEKQAMIVRQNALTNAVAFLSAKAGLDKKPDELTTDNVIVVATKFAAFSFGEKKLEGSPRLSPEEPLPEPSPEDIPF